MDTLFISVLTPPVCGSISNGIMLCDGRIARRVSQAQVQWERMRFSSREVLVKSQSLIESPQSIILVSAMLCSDCSGQ